MYGLAEDHTTAGHRPAVALHATKMLRLRQRPCAGRKHALHPLHHENAKDQFPQGARKYG